jgi:hypothetical protein
MPRMVRSRRTVALLVLMLGAGLASGIGCADTDPNYGPPGIIKGREVDFGLDAGAAKIPETAPSTKSATELFADLFATITDATEAKGSTCLPCHGTTQVPVFMAATAEATRTNFKTMGFDKLATSRFYNKGAHTGKALQAPQKTLVEQWAAAEAAGGAAPGGGG